MAHRFKVAEELSREELEQFKEFIRERNYARSIDECHEWIQARGYTGGRTAVWNWVQRFAMEDQYRASSEMANAMVETAKHQGVVAISDATALQIQSMIFQKGLDAQVKGDLSTKDLLGLSLAFKTVVAGKRGVEQLKKEVAEAIATAEKMVKEGAGGEAVVNKVRELLGIES
jgi:hypothetical protein